MKKQKTVVIFAGIRCSDNRKDYYYKLAYRTGKLLAENGLVVATGAGPGLMNMALKGAHEAGGKTIGVALDIAGREQSKYADTIFSFKDLKDRQKKLIEIGDAFIVLPGGTGTLHEMSEVIVQKKLKKIDPKKPIILISDFYKNIEAFFNNLTLEEFSNTPLDKLCKFAESPEKSIKIIKS